MEACVPIWQFALLIGLSTIFVLCDALKLVLFSTYVFCFYWGWKCIYGTYTTVDNTSIYSGLFIASRLASCLSRLIRIA